MKTHSVSVVLALLLSNFLAFSAHATPQGDRELSIKKLGDHGVLLRDKPRMTAEDKNHIRALAQQNLPNYKLLNVNGFDTLGFAYDEQTNQAKPILLDNFTGNDLKLNPCSDGPTCGIPALNPQPGTANYEKELLVKKAIELASGSDQPIRVHQTVKHNGQDKEVDVDYFVVVKAVHKGSICYTTFYLGNARKVCY